MKKELLDAVRAFVGDEEVERNFTPRYRPWQQRLAFEPEGDLFKGVIVHPQTWPKDLDYKDKEVLVIGSGATTATVVPAIAADTAHTTVLQRSPTYFMPAPNKNELADTLRELDIDKRCGSTRSCGERSCTISTSRRSAASKNATW